MIIIIFRSIHIEQQRRRRPCCGARGTCVYVCIRCCGPSRRCGAHTYFIYRILSGKTKPESDGDAYMRSWRYDAAVAAVSSSVVDTTGARWLVIFLLSAVFWNCLQNLKIFFFWALDFRIKTLSSGKFSQFGALSGCIDCTCTANDFSILITNIPNLISRS